MIFTVGKQKFKHFSASIILSTVNSVYWECPSYEQISQQDAFFYFNENKKDIYYLLIY